MGQYEKVIEYYEKVFMIDEEKGYKNDFVKCYNNFGLVYSVFGLYEKLIVYDNCVLQFYKVVKDIKGEMICFINFGVKFNDFG